MMAKFFMVLFFCFTAPARACLVSLAALSPSQESAAVETYTSLLDQLGGKLSAETLKKIAESGDPFSVPEQAEADLGGLRRSLEQFRRMIESTGDVSRDLKRQLLLVAMARARGIGAAVQAVGQRVAASQLDERLTQFTLDPDRGYLAFDNERYLVARVSRHRQGGAETWRVYDKTNGKVSEQNFVEWKVGRGVFTGI